MMTTTELDRLIDTGRQRGGLEINDIRQALPIDTMSIEEISDALTHIEEAGISVEIDPTMLTARSPQLTLPEVKPATGCPRTTTSRDRALIRTRSIKAAIENSPATAESENPHVQKFTTIIILAAALILVLITMGWHFV